MKKLALVVLVVLALPATAVAKGPSRAAIAGPGITTIRISGAEGSATPFWRLVGATGWFEAAWGSPSRLPQEQPQAELGPRFTITWRVPSSNSLRQDVYPYAQPYPLTYMPRGQALYGTPVRGGWYAGGARLEKALLHIGLPAVAPASAPSAASAAPDGIAAAAAFFALAGAASSRRPRS
jgi:hypothetical protein